MKAISVVLFVLLLGTFAQAQQRWTRAYGGVGTDHGYSVKQTPDGGYIVAGATNSFGAGGYDYDVYLIKTNASGDTLWTRTYGYYGVGNLDWGYDVQLTSDGGYIITGKTSSFGNGSQVYLIKTNASGDTLWTRTYGGPYLDEGRSVQHSSDGGYIIAGETNPDGGSYYDVSLIKTNASGDAVWTKTYGGASWDYA